NVRRRDHEETPDDVRATELAPLDAHRQSAKIVVDLWRDHRHLRLAVEQTVHLLRRDAPAADNEAVATTKIQARHVIAGIAHVARLVRRAPFVSRRTDASTPPASIVIVNAPGATAAIFTASICWPFNACNADVTSRALSER